MAQADPRHKGSKSVVPAHFFLGSNHASGAPQHRRGARAATASPISAILFARPFLCSSAAIPFSFFLRLLQEITAPGFGGEGGGSTVPRVRARNKKEAAQ
nr:hypothetical protein [Pandoravirus massiliensis]